MVNSYRKGRFDGDVRISPGPCRNVSAWLPICQFLDRVRYFIHASADRHHSRDPYLAAWCSTYVGCRVDILGGFDAALCRIGLQRGLPEKKMGQEARDPSGLDIREAERSKTAPPGGSAPWRHSRTVCHRKSH